MQRLNRPKALPLKTCWVVLGHASGFSTRYLLCATQEIQYLDEGGLRGTPGGEEIALDIRRVETPLCRPFLLIVLASVVLDLMMINYYLMWWYIIVCSP